MIKISLSHAKGSLVYDLFLATWFILVLTSCALQTRWVQYQSETYQLAFQYPEDWSVEERDSVLLVENPLGWGLEILVDTSEYAKVGENPAQILENIRSQVKFHGLESEESIQTFTLNGYAAASKRFLIRGEIRTPAEWQGAPTPITAPHEVVVIVLQDGDREVIITTNQIDGRWRELDQQLEAIVRSFRFLK